MDKNDVLRNCSIENNIVYLPNIQLDRKLYQDVAKSLELIGGKWKGGKIGGFIFPHDPTELLAQISNGESRNLKKESQSFFTPSSLADRMAEMLDINEECTIYDPSAGHGALLEAVLRIDSNADISYSENNPLHLIVLIDKFKINPVSEDFFNISDEHKFDRIIANPPFSNNQDIDHIHKMYSCLKSKGKLVTLSSAHWVFSNNQKEILFRKWLKVVDAWVDTIPAGTFKESGTMIETRIIVINKK
jgi:type I restriction-modification system DNA methylase subunit